MREPTLQAFVMHGAREAVAAGLGQVASQVETLERAVFDNPALAFDLARTIAEAACRTILTDRVIPWAKGDDVPKLFSTVTANLSKLPVGSTDAKARQTLDNMLGGLRNALVGVCELRGAYGFASHGRDGTKPAMESMQALLAAQTVDALVGFLYRAHRGDHRKELAARADRDRTTKALIDFNYYDPALIADRPYPHSDALLAIDKDGWEEWATAFDESRNVLGELKAKFSAILHPDLSRVSFVHHDDVAYLRIEDSNQNVRVYDASAADSGEPGDEKFPASRSPDQNADALAQHWEDWGLAILFPALLKDQEAKRLNEQVNKDTEWIGEMLAREITAEALLTNSTEAVDPPPEEEPTDGNV